MTCINSVFGQKDFNAKASVFIGIIRAIQMQTTLATSLMKHTEEEIFAHTRKVMVELFELEENTLVPTARLYDDLDIDSIDAVDLLIELKKFVGTSISPQHFKEAETLQDIVDIIADL